MAGSIRVQRITLHLRIGKNFGYRVFDHRNPMFVGYPAVEIRCGQILKNSSRDTRFWRCQQNRLRSMSLYYGYNLPQIGDCLFLGNMAQHVVTAQCHKHQSRIVRLKKRRQTA